MAAPFHDSIATTNPPPMETYTSPLLPTPEYNNYSMNLWFSIDPTFAWPYPPSTQYDPRFWAWPVGTHPLFDQGPALPKYAEIPPWTSTLGPPVNPSTSLDVLPPNTAVEAQPETITHYTTAIEAQPPRNDRQANSEPTTEPSTYRCKWEGCTYTGTFVKESVLWRHIRSTHLAPDSLKCPAPKCRKSFGRKDKYNAHVRLVHRDMADLLDTPTLKACA